MDKKPAARDLNVDDDVWWLSKHGGKKFCDRYLSFDRYLKTGEEPLVRAGAARVFVHLAEHESVILESGVIPPRRLIGLARTDRYWGRLAEDCRECERSDGNTGVSVVVPNRTRHRGYKFLAILNADEEDNGHFDSHKSLVSFCNDAGIGPMPTVSYRCLSQFYHGRDDRVVDGIKSGKLVLLDFSPDETIPLTAKDRAELRKNKRSSLPHQASDCLRPPKHGFSVVGVVANARWHRSGSCLFHDQTLDRYLLLGQDEGTYFGCELAGPAKTLQAAYDSLVPAEAKGKRYTRQGEWFMVPVPEGDVPPTVDCVLQFDKAAVSGTCATSAVFLPLESVDGNRHSLWTADGRVGKDGRVYALDPEITHTDHEALSASGWYTFYRNTALRSVSTEGVD